MSVGLNVTLIDTQDGSQTVLTFPRLPVRIGRNALNDIRLGSGYVSQFHAVVDMVGDTILLWDLGSRNGTFLPSQGNAPPNSAIDLSTTGFEFGIATTVFRVSRVTLSDAPMSRRRGGVRDIVEENTRVGVNVSSMLASKMKPLYDNYRVAWADLHRDIQSTIGPLDPDMRARVCDELVTAFPGLYREPDFRRLSSDSTSLQVDFDGADSSIPDSRAADSHSESRSESRPSSRVLDSSVSDPPRDEAVALEGLRQLATWYLPGKPPPTGSDELLGFLETIQDTLDVFLKCFVPLRDGYAYFRAQMDIQRRREPRPGGDQRVTAARDPSELAAAMLDWRTTSGDEPRVVEDTFADLMIHHAAMLNGIMRGVKSLLSELAPDTIEKTLEDPRKNRGGLQIGPFRYKQLWDQYVERHSDLSAEDREAFALIFGPQFAQAYAQFAEGAAASPGAGGNAGGAGPAGTQMSPIAVAPGAYSLTDETAVPPDPRDSRDLRAAQNRTMVPPKAPGGSGGRRP